MYKTKGQNLFSELLQRIMRNPKPVCKQQSVKNTSPLQLVVKMCDLVIQPMYCEDEKEVKDILSTSGTGLNFDYDPADQLFFHYSHCQEPAHKREVSDPLRDTWQKSASQNGVSVNGQN